MIVYRDRAEIERSEKGLTVPLMFFFDCFGGYRCYPNVHLFPWESDLVVVSKSGYAQEVEVKISYADWAVDAKKDKWKPDWHKGWYRDDGMGRPIKLVEPVDLNEARGWKYVKKFWYAVPQSIAEKPPENLPEYAGILAVQPKGQVRVIRDAQTRKAVRLSDVQQDRLHGSMYYRFVREFTRRVK